MAGFASCGFKLKSSEPKSSEKDELIAQKERLIDETADDFLVIGQYFVLDDEDDEKAAKKATYKAILSALCDHLATEEGVDTIEKQYHTQEEKSLFRRVYITCEDLDDKK